MTIWLLAPVLAVAAAAVALATLFWAGRFRWRRSSRRLEARLEAARAGSPAASTRGSFDPRSLDGLPPPVRRWLAEAIEPGRAAVSTAVVEHAGTFNLGGDRDRWLPLTSRQLVVTGPPGFLWDARVRMAPGIAVHVHDAYLAGEGVLRASLIGLIPVMRQAPTPELARGELLRYLAEAAWYPTALLPGGGVRWEAHDDRSARATLVDGEVTASLLFGFDREGRVATVAGERDRLLDGRPVATPWEGRFWDHERHDGLLIPMSGEVAWRLPEGRKPYWRARIRRVAYESRHAHLAAERGRLG